MKETISILVIDDDLDDQKFFQMAVSKISPAIDCSFADNCIEALEMLKDISKLSPDFIFLDINMPVMNGMECLLEMKKIKKLQSTPVYMFTTSADEHITQSFVSLGATGLIKKVPSIVGLKEILSKILQAVS